MIEKLTLEHKVGIKQSLIHLLVEKDSNTTDKTIEKAQKLYEFIVKE
jgi:hypothetical protein